MTFIIKAASEPKGFTVRFLEYFTLQPISRDSLSHVICAPFFLDEDNLQGWFFAEDDGNQIKKQKHPLLLRQMPVVMSKLQEFKVRLLYFPKVGQF